jgi:hypothetical protein
MCGPNGLRRETRFEVSKGNFVKLAACGKKPIVRLVPVSNEHGERRPGWLKGKIKLGPEFFEPLPPEELDLWWK